ncbi:methionine adenosyltransferase 2 subunit beta-like [Convolutriloba macropyga]|uniref:methionine adenosyltransferase 2 subunit beta-like n=1 Tax=Convolutriloba macropyga TaxID=536237 RepID=UPI003F520378
MRVLLTGASGLLGRAVLSKFSSSSFEIIGTGFSRAAPPVVKLNILDAGAVESFIDDHTPDIVIHAAAERRPEAVQENYDQAKQLNVDSTDNLASICARKDVYLIYISTDYVFDGEKPPFQVDDKPNPLNKYGELKLAGETCVKEKEGLKWCILRIPVLYGCTDKLDESAVTILYQALLQSIENKRMAKMNHIERRYPTFTEDAAGFLIRVCEKYEEDGKAVGVLHFIGDECMTKYEMVQRMAKLKDKSLDFIEAETKVSSTVKRPFDCFLSMDKCKDLNLQCSRTSFDTAILTVLQNF